ncbi:MAG: 2-C-methyl-D-erythritol 4-phosphate cytidylyltransferase [Fibromonadaceae bacterium]|jgi:2-C-methyl-D-erythritol 4-phosphate cytidylyltransferase|nr:2-C-methyl-D-erythritol 4-phosphate cytidylyltransferase [Fibromonadaceae bacterium]
MNVALILSGGTGTRFGSELPKQYQILAGKEVISYSIEALKKESIVIVTDKESIKRLSETYGVTCIEGGATRNESLKKGLDYIKVTYSICQKIFINEAARPFLTADLVDLYLKYLDGYDAVITAQYITDSLGRNGEVVTDRSEYYLIQAPEAFRFDLLYRYFKADSPITATVQQLPAERKVMRYFDFKRNIKITYKEDLQYAEQFISK